jgi:hypothetical protein
MDGDAARLSGCPDCLVIAGSSPPLIAIRFCNFSALGVFYQQELNTAHLKETHMHTLTTKLAALAGTLLMTTLVMGAVAYCFVLQPNTYLPAVGLAQAVATQGLG